MHHTRGDIRHTLDGPATPTLAHAPQARRKSMPATLSPNSCARLPTLCLIIVATLGGWARPCTSCSTRPTALLGNPCPPRQHRHLAHAAPPARRRAQHAGALHWAPKRHSSGLHYAQSPPLQHHEQLSAHPRHHRQRRNQTESEDRQRPWSSITSSHWRIHGTICTANGMNVASTVGSWCSVPRVCARPGAAAAEAVLPPPNVTAPRPRLTAPRPRLTGAAAAEAVLPPPNGTNVSKAIGSVTGCMGGRAVLESNGTNSTRGSAVASRRCGFFFGLRASSSVPSRSSPSTVRAACCCSSMVNGVRVHTFGGANHEPHGAIASA